MQYERRRYLNKLIQKKENGRIKVITGLRRCGKSYLLFNLYRQYLLDLGVKEEQIFCMALDEIDYVKYRNPFELNNVIKEFISDPSKHYYIFIDEIQFVSEVSNPYVDNPKEKITFIDVLLGLMKIKNVDIYVTGSNSKMLSSDILTQFRDRADEIKVNPLSFAEVYERYQGDKRNVWREYYTYGGMPMVWLLDSHEEKSRYLKDVLERHKVKNNKEVLEILLNVLASSIGSLTNPSKLSKIFKSERNMAISPDTIDTYIDYFKEAFLLQKALRYDVKGRKYIKTPVKYYYSDVGFRNARLSFRQLEETHIMENVIYNDLVRRGFDVDVGVVEQNVRTNEGKNIRKQLEVDFVINRGNEKYYIQSALSIDNEDKRKQEIASLLRIPDSFKKIVIVKDYINPWMDENGILYIGVEDFLLEESFIS